MVKRKSPKTAKKPQKYVVCGAIRMRSRKVTKIKAHSLAKRIRKSGGTAKIRKV